MTNWKTQKLTHLCTKIGSGSTPRGGDASYKSHGISLIRSQNVLDFSFSKGGLAFIDEKQAKELANVELKERDVLLNITGDSVARVCQVPNNILPARVNQHVAILRANKEILNPEYLKYYLLANSNKERLLSLASIGATRKALTKGMLEEFDINLPDEKGTITQTRIASILSSLDDKIELNHRTNQIFEQIVQTLFKNYFVDGIDRENLPKGWTCGKLSQIFSQSRDTINPGNYPDKHFDHYSLPAYDESERPSIEVGSSILSNKSIVKSNSILFSKLNPRFPRVWPIGIINESIAICSTEFLVFIPQKPEYFSFTYLKLKEDEFKNELVNKATGTSGSHQRIRPDDILQIEELLPPDILLQEFEKVARPFIQKKIDLLEESLTLIKLRNSLLPKLMNGEIELN